MHRHETHEKSYLLRFVAVLGLAALFVLLMGLILSTAPAAEAADERAHTAVSALSP